MFESRQSPNDEGCPRAESEVDAELQRSLDRLADGEISHDQLAALFDRLEEEPRRWKRCALTLIESQVLRRALAPLANAPVQPLTAATGDRPLPLLPEAASRPHVRGRPRPRWIGMLSIAASWLALFAAGWSVGRNSWESSRPSPHALIAGSSAAPTQSGGLLQRGAPQRGLPSSTPADGGALHVPLHPQGMLQFVLDSGNGVAQPIELPVFTADQADAFRRDRPNWAADFAAWMPAEVEQSLRRAGYQVRREQQFYSVGVDGERTVVFPMERVEIVPVSY